MNHENTKSKKHEMFRAVFRDFVMKKTSNIQRQASNFEHFAGGQKLTRNLKLGNSDNFKSGLDRK